MNPVLLIGAADDAHVSALERNLKERNVDVAIVDTLAFPDEGTISLGEGLDEIRVDGRPVGRPGAVYVRGTYAHPLSFGVDAGEEMEADWRRTLVAYREKSMLLMPLLARWSELGVPVYNPISSEWRHTKAFQLAALAAAGLPVPATLWTNDPVAVRRFAEGRRVIFKPVAGGAATRELRAEDLERLGALRGAPVTFQELLEGDNYRVYCLDGEIVASIRIVASALDFRQNEEIVEEVALSDEVLGACLRAAEVVGMRWTGMDLRADSEGTLRFLELNSSPMFLGFDARAGTKILERFADRLASVARKGYLQQTEETDTIRTKYQKGG